MDNNSLSHTTWNCKYHIVFASNIEEDLFPFISTLNILRKIIELQPRHMSYYISDFHII